MNLKSQKPSDMVLAARTALLETLQHYSTNLRADEILALLAHLLGQTLAMQDQYLMTHAQYMDLVVKNIETGNAEAIASVMNSQGNA